MTLSYYERQMRAGDEAARKLAILRSRVESDIADKQERELASKETQQQGMFAKIRQWFNG